jgi:predicted transcriptional regulator
MMETENHRNSLQEAEKHASLTDLLGMLEENCKNCNPLTPITCVTGCKTWRLKNQFRKLHEKTKNPDYMTNLLNTLKNKRRLQLLEIISKDRHSLERLQQKIKELGFNHGQRTIFEEYINPLIEVGLVDEDQNVYSATVFGCRLNGLVKDFRDVAEILPPHSECYEETALDMLLKGPKTYEDLEGIIPAKSVARVLSRLQKAALAETNNEKDYVFFFTTKRDPNGSSLSPTERRVYEKIPVEGISARKLAEKAGISLRRTYKYLRKLKGKKLVFTRKKPTSYALTTKGARIATMLGTLHKLAVGALTTTSRLMENEQSGNGLTMDAYPVGKKREDEEIIPFTTIQRAGQN